MGTRSNIGIINPDDSVDMVYCHWDGYPSNNGNILLKNWSDTEAVRNLLRMGDISSLGPVIGEKHDFMKGREGQCTFYKRDRGESEVESRHYKNAAAAKVYMQEYLYLWDTKTNVWYYSDNGADIVPLTPEKCVD